MVGRQGADSSIWWAPMGDECRLRAGSRSGRRNLGRPALGQRRRGELGQLFGGAVIDEQVVAGVQETPSHRLGPCGRGL